MGITGPFVELRSIVQKTRAVSSIIRSSAMSRVLAETARDLVDEGFAEGKSPEGKPWKALRDRNGQPLRDTRRLQSSYTYNAYPRGFELGTNVQYAATHQFGATIQSLRGPHNRLSWIGSNGKRRFAKKVTIPARPMLPKSVSPSSPWGKVLRRAAERVIAEAMR